MLEGLYRVKHQYGTANRTVSVIQNLLQGVMSNARAEPLSEKARRTVINK